MAYTLSSKLDQALTDAAAARADLASSAARDRAREEQVTALREKLDETRAQVREGAETLRLLSASDETMGTKLRTANTVIEELHDDLARIEGSLSGTREEDAEKAAPSEMAGGKAKLSSGMPAPIGEELERACPACGLRVFTQDVTTLVNAPSDAMFDADSAALRPNARATLTALAHLLHATNWRGALGISVQAPLPSGAPASTLLLASGRAAAVAELLEFSGVDPQAVKAIANAGSGQGIDAGTSRAARDGLEISLAPAPQTAGLTQAR
jgi:outer membrane protein OmpA-like peptidoglycan-associated protein